jgi:ribosomal protein S18 acetylase RimI-like enzyme
VDSTDITIEPATAEDLPSVIEIDHAMTGSAKSEFWYEYFYRQSSRTHSIFLVARLDGQVAGYIIGSVRVWEFGSPPAGWIHAIGIAEAHRKQGIGTAMFRRITDFFLSCGTRTVRTMLHIDDHLLMSFFRFQGMSAGPFIELDMTLEEAEPPPAAS